MTVLIAKFFFPDPNAIVGCFSYVSFTHENAYTDYAVDKMRDKCQTAGS